MRKCPSCGFNNPEAREKCVKCSATLATQAVPDGSHVADKRAPLPDPAILLRRLLYGLGEKLSGRLPANVSHRYHWTAAYLSILPGGGQFYNHQPLKALVFIFLWIAVVAFLVLTFFEPWNNWAALLVAFWLFYAMADGFVTANRINGAYWRWKQVLAVWFSFMFFLGAFLFLAQFFACGGLFYLVTIRQDGLAPQIRAGDKIFVLSTMLSPRPEKGAVVYYDPPPYTIIRFTGLSNDTYSVNTRNSFGVVTAIGGEVVASRDDGLIRVDGDPVPSRLLPLVPNGVPYNVEFRIPDGEFGVLTSAPVVDRAIIDKVFNFGGSWNASTPTPRVAAMGEGYGLREYEDSSMVTEDEIWGIALFRYYPPERRTWFGWSGGLWSDYPSDYPAAKP